MSIEGPIPNKVETEETHEGLSASESLKGTIALGVIGAIMSATAANAEKSIEDCAASNFYSAINSYSSTLEETQTNLKETSAARKTAEAAVAALGYSAPGSLNALKAEMKTNKEVEKAVAEHDEHIRKLTEVTAACKEKVDNLFYKLDDAKISGTPEVTKQLQEMYERATASLKVLEDLTEKSRNR